jgi:hypothetical protein
MKAFELVGDVDERHRLQADVAPGPVRVIALVAAESRLAGLVPPIFNAAFGGPCAFDRR